MTQTATTLQPTDETQLIKSFRSDITFLRTIPMFADLADIELARLLQVASFRDFPAKTVLLEEGVMNDALYLIRKGSVEFFHYGKNPEPFLTLGRSRFFGHVSMFDPAPASATVRAATDVEVICLRSSALNSLLLAHPAVGTRLLMAIIQDLAKRHRQMMQELKQTQETVHL
jgi:CRP-like cAMP-binding protein